MNSIVVDDTLISQDIRHDGTVWPMAMSRGGTTVFADNAGDLVAHLIPGYDTIPDNEAGHNDALIARWQAGVSTASDVQSVICADRAHQGLFDPATESEDILTALLADKTIPIDNIGTWDNEHVQLVLIATDYAPFTDRAPITGNVLWIDPSDEIAFLHSLANPSFTTTKIIDTAGALASLTPPGPLPRHETSRDREPKLNSAALSPLRHRLALPQHLPAATAANIDAAFRRVNSALDMNWIQDDNRCI